MLCLEFEQESLLMPDLADLFKISLKGRSSVAAGVVPTVRHHVMNDNVTGDHGKVTQVGSEESGRQVFPLTTNNHCHL